LDLVYLTRGGERHGIDLEDLIGQPPAGYFAAQKLQDLEGVQLNPMTRLDDQNGPLAPRGIRPGNYRRETHGRMGSHDIFDFGRVYPFAARLDQVLRAPVDGYIAGLIDAGQIARIEKPKRVQGACVGFEIAFDHAGTLDFKVTDHTTLVRKIDAARIELSRKVEVVHDPAITALGSKFRHKVRVAVHFKDGTIEEETREQPRGGEDAFAPAADIIEKFKKLSRATMSEAQQADLIDMILNMESLPDMRALPEALRTG